MICFVIFCTIFAGASFGAQTIKLGDSPSGAVLLMQDQTGMSMRMDIESIELQQLTTPDGEFTALAIPGFVRSNEIGEPNLPTLNRIIAIPFGCELQAEVLDYESDEISLEDYGMTAPIIPVQPSISKSQNPADVPFQYKREIYERSGYYALPLAKTSDVGVMRALHLGMISVAPVQYDPLRNMIRVYKSVTLKISYLHPDQVKTERMRRDYYSPFFEPVYARLFNYQPIPSILLDDLTRYPVKYAIVADRMFETQLQQFIQWKTKKGFNVITAYTDEIGHSNTEIRGYLQDLYDNGNEEDPAPSFVLLVGDDQQIQAFQCAGHISDLNFCEYTNDHIPEVYYGRFSAQNPSQLQPQIDKTLEYEQYLMPDPSFLDRVTLIAGVDPTFGPTHGNGQINYGTNEYFNEDHGLFANVWLYPRSNEPGAAGEIIQTVDDGLSFINYTAHGSHNGWANPAFETGDISGLSNAHMYPLAVGNCCLTNTFGDDYSTPCAGEVWLQSADKGAVGYIGGSNNTYWDEDYWWGVGFKAVVPGGPPYDPNHIGAYDGMFHDHGEPLEQHYVTNDAVLFCGNMAVQESNSSMKNYYWEIYHLMGDPSIMTYIGVPSANAVDHPETIVLGQSSITIYADPYSYAGLSMEGVLYGSVFVDESGSAELEFTPFDVPGMADLVVTGQNREPYMDVIPVIAPSGPYVVFDSCTVNDINGNNNGLIDFGESILLGVRLVNVGPDPAPDVIAVLTSVDPYVTMTDTLASFGDIEGDFGESEIPNAYSFDVSVNAPDGHVIPFELNIISGQDSWTSQFSLTVHSPELEFVDVIVDDQSGGNGNGIFEAGETAELTVSLCNEGSCMAGSVAGTIVTTDEYVTVDDGEGTFGDIEPSGGTGNNSQDVFVITASDDLPQGHAVMFDLALTADGGFAQDIQFEVRAIESFEYNDGGWAGDGEWEWGEPLSGPGSAYDGSKVWATNLAGEYSDDADDTLRTCFYTVESRSASFSFYHWYSFEDGYDGGNVSISTDGGYIWSLLTPQRGYDDTYIDGLDGEPGFTGSSAGWMEETFDIGAFEGMIVILSFRFGTDGSVTDAGWYVDAISATGVRSLRGAPYLSFTPRTYNVELEQGQVSDQNLVVSNAGQGILAYALTPVTVGRRLRIGGDRESGFDPFSIHPEWGKLIEYSGNGNLLTVTYKGPKLESQEDEDPPLVITDFGGPDDYGYMWIDSNEPDGPQFQWVDITGIGEPLTFTDDQNQGPFSLGFSFSFYGSCFASVRICSNGFLSFTSTSLAYTNATIPTTGEPNSLICPFWDDLNPEDGGVIYFYTNDVDSCVVAWVGIPRFSDGGSLTFETVITADGNIVVQYLDMQGTVNSCTVGIENMDGTDGLQVVYNSSYVSDGLAVKFVAPTFWLDVDPNFGMNQPGESSDFTVTFDATDLDLGVYSGYLRIDSNDPDNPTMAVECTLTVSRQTGIADGDPLPTSYSLMQNYPNPFNPSTRIGFGLPSAGHVTLTIYDLLGRQVVRIVDRYMTPGYHYVEFDGSGMASGVYFYRLKAGEFENIRRMMILK